jgi:serine/threonine-protein kinase
VTDDGSNLEAAAGVREGQVLAGKYRVERILGVGGMGAVVAAHHLQLDSKVAIKFLLPDMLANQEAVARFANEARRAVKITSEHVARVYDVGALENGAPYMVMEYLQGADLSVLLHQRGPLPLEDAVDFLLQAMEAIAEAHALGIVHRDLKPANLYIIQKPDGRLHIKVLDFGISKSTDGAGGPASLSRTVTAALMGSPFYMAPEQMEGGTEIDARVDVWALGVILFELLTGKVPFDGTTVPEISIRIATRPPPPLREIRPDVPDALQRVVSGCLEKDRERRFRTVADLAAALLPFAPARSQPSAERIANTLRSAPPPGVRSTPPPAGYALPRIETLPPMGRTTNGGSRGANPGLFVAIGGLLLAGGGVGAVLLLGPRLPWFGAHAGPGTGTVALDAGNAASPDGGAPPLCTAGSTRCEGRTPQTCTDGRWITGEVTAGQCDAVCTPGTSAPQCSGNTPQTCDETGQWLDKLPCPSACKAGACVSCAPGATECTGRHHVRTCSVDGEWEPPSVCPSAEVCRDGVCVRGGPGPGPNQPPPPPQTKPNCDPNYWLDAQGQKHFKPECFQNK